MQASAFASILRAAVRQTPGALGSAFAADDGETVDAITVAPGHTPLDESFLAAHYGVVLGQIQSALHTLHYGEAEIVTLMHRELWVLVRPVKDGYFAILALAPAASLAAAMLALDRAASALAEEMG